MAQSIKKITDKVSIDGFGNIRNDGYLESNHVFLHVKSSRPTTIPSTGLLWAQNNSVIFTDPSNTDHDLTVGGSFTASGDLSGSSSSQTVTGLQGRPISTTAPDDGYYLGWNTSLNQWLPKSAPSGSFTASGDLSGTSSSQTVIGLQGRSVSTTIPTDGYALVWSTSANKWQPGIVATSSGSFIAGGDLTGDSTSQTVVKIQGKSVSSSTPTDGYALAWNNSANQWQPYSTSQITGYDLTDIYSNVITDPSGFTSQTTSTVTITPGSRLFQIAPTSGSFSFYVKGKKFTKNSAQTINWSTTDGLNFIYFDVNGVLQTTTDINVWKSVIYGHGACVWVVNWDSTNNIVRRSLEERHGTAMPGIVHWYNHAFLGTQWISGGTLGNFVIGNGSLDTHAQFSCSDCVIADEDFDFNITNGSPQTLSTILNAPVFYRNGASGLWLFKNANGFPIIASGEAGYTGANGRACYNQYTGATWTRTEVAQGNYFLAHILATTDGYAPIISILGQNEYLTSAAAQSGATTEAGSLQGVLGLLSTEYKFLGTVIYQTATTYANSVKCRIVQISGGFNYIDLRTSKITGSGAITNNHNSLIGLTNDDHLQYVHISNARTITAQHTFSPATTTAPFILGANAQSQLVTGLNADLLDGYHASQLLGGGGFLAGGDLSGTSSSQTVIGLQGRSISTTTPTDGYALVWSASNNQWQPGVVATSGGSFTAGGDLTGNSTSQTVVKIQGKSVSSTTPTDGQVLTWVAANNDWEPKTSSSSSGGSTTVYRRTATDGYTSLCYTLDETSTPWTNTGIAGSLNLTNTYGAVSSVSGIFGNCLDFDGVSGLVSADTSLGESSNSLSISFWTQLQDPSAQRYTPTDGYTIYNFKFDETSATSFSESINNAITLTPIAAIGSGVISVQQGLFNNAVAISATSNTSFLSSTGSLSGTDNNEHATTNVTVSAWVRLRNLATYCAVIGKAYRTNGSWTAPYFGGIPMYIYNGKFYGQAVVGGTAYTVFSDTIVPVNEWLHLAQTYDGTTVKGYVNGIQVTSVTIAGTLDFGLHGPWYIGGDGGSGGGYERFDGLIEDIRIENTLRSADYLKNMYQRGVGIGGFVGGEFIDKKYQTGTTWTTPYTSIAISEKDDGSLSASLYINSAQRTVSVSRAYLPLYQWLLIGLTYDGATISLYVNGNSVATSNVAGTIDWGNHGSWQIGAKTTQSLGGIVGRIDDLRIENIVRSSSYFSSMYNLGVYAGPSLSTDVVIDANTDYEWRITETAGTTISNSGVAGVEPLTLGAGVTFLTGSDSIYDNAINCPVSPSTAVASSATDISFVAGTGLTVQAWINPTTLQSNGCIVARQYTDGSWTPSPYNAFYLGCLTTGGLLVQIATPGHNTVSFSPTYGAAISILDWNHVAFTYNPTTGLLLGYVNGRVIGSTTLAGNVSFGSATPGPLLIGGVPVLGAVQKFDGAICRVRIEHTVRSATYISKLFLRGQLKASQME